MTAAAISVPPRSAGVPPQTVVAAGVAGGLIDIVYACGAGALGGRSPEVVLQSIASGWLGKAAYHEGASSAVLGLATHFGVTILMAGTYALASSRLPVLRRRPWTMGALYGVALYAVMYGIVLPLRWPAIFPKFDGVTSFTDLLSHLGVGLAIALVVAGRRRVDPA